MDLTLEFGKFVVEILFWYFVISVIFNLLFRKNSKTAELQKQIEELKSYVHFVNLEEHNNVLYWFDKETDEFLAQGKTIAEAAAVLKSRFPNHVFFVSDKGNDYMVSSATNWQPQEYQVNSRS